MTEVGRVALAARVFTIAALTSIAGLAGADYLRSALLVVVTAVIAIGLSLSRRFSETTVALLEGSVVAVLAALTYPDQAAITPYLAIPALIGALDLGVRGLLRVAVTEFSILLALSLIVARGWDREVAATGFTWLATAIGIGLMGSSMRRAATRPDADASYRSAVALIRRLEALSGKLSGGLDAVGIAEQIIGRGGQRRAHPERGRLRALLSGLDGSAALLGRHPVRRDGLGRDAVGQVLGRRGDDAA